MSVTLGNNEFLALHLIVVHCLHSCPCDSHFSHGSLLWMLSARSLLVFLARFRHSVISNACYSFLW